MLSINAAKGFYYGWGFDGLDKTGSEYNDSFQNTGSGIRTLSNHSGGIQGGISNGEDIVFRVAFKPIASIKKAQDTVNTEGENTSVYISGRHDPCVLPRAVPRVEAMAAWVLADHLLLSRLARVS